MLYVKLDFQVEKTNNKKIGKTNFRRTQRNQ